MEKRASPTKTMLSTDRDALMKEARLQRMQIILENEEKTRVALHNKIEKSSPVFANTKVTSCSSVLMTNGASVCVPFRSPSVGGHEVKKRHDRLSSVTQYAQNHINNL